MVSRRLLFAQFAALGVLLVVQLVAMDFYARSYSEWAFIPSHLFGGIWAGLFGLWVTHLFGIAPRVSIALISALVLGVCWEFLEVRAGLFLGPNYLAETGTDIATDLLGGLAAFYWAQKIA